jgi:PncC family amidohydrolase
VTLHNGELQHAAEHVADMLDGRSLACAESCTAGLLAQAFAAVEGSGEWFRGGIVAYQRCAKIRLLDVRADQPLVSPTVAEQMARAAVRHFDADIGIASTGAAGPDPLDGALPGTVVLGLLVNGSFRSVRRVYDEDDPKRVVERAAIDAIKSLAGMLIATDGLSQPRRVDSATDSAEPSRI